MATISKYETSSGTMLYRVRYRTPDHRQTDKRGFKTKRDAEAFANTVEVKKLTGEYIPETAGRITIAERWHRTGSPARNKPPRRPITG